MNDTISLDEIGRRWGELLNQAFARIITLERKIEIIEAENVRLRLALSQGNEAKSEPG